MRLQADLKEFDIKFPYRVNGVTEQVSQHYKNNLIQAHKMYVLSKMSNSNTRYSSCDTIKYYLRKSVKILEKGFKHCRN